MFTESTEKINRSFKFLLLSRAARSMALIFVTLSLSLYLNILGYSLVFIGILYLVIVLFNMIFALVLGMLGDRIGYAKSLIIGELLPLIAILGLALSSNIYVISVSAIIGGITGSAGGMRGAFSPGMTAYVASSWPEEHDRVGRLARINVVASVFSIFGGFFLIFHGYLSPIYGNVIAFRFLFAVSFFILLVSFISLMLLKERKRPMKTTHVMKLVRADLDRLPDAVGLPNRWPTQKWARDVADRELALELEGNFHRLMSPVPEINGYVSLLRDTGAAARINPACKQLALRVLERMGLSLYSFENPQAEKAEM